ncbi:MAG: hypothetical protein ACRD1N_00560 [Terriglobia bacterium]
MALVEMVIATAIAVVLMGVAFHFFDDLEGMTESVSVMSEVNSSLRASADLITRDLYAAGTSIPTGGIPLPSLNGVTQVKRPGLGSTDFPSTSNGSNGVVLSVITPGQGLSGTIDGKVSDEITIITTDPYWTSQNLPVASVTSSISTGYTVDVTIPGAPECTSNCSIAAGGQYAVSTGDLLMFSSGGGYALGMVTSVDTTSNIIYFAADPLDLDQVCAGATGCGGTIDSLEVGGAYPPGITLTKIDMITYYIDNSNPSHPYTLERELGASAPTAVAYGINNLQFTYDLSTGGSGSTDLPSPVNPNQISKVNLWLSGISNYALRRSRQYYSSNIASAVTIRNLEYVNQFP